MATTFDVIYLGTAARLDPTEGNDFGENASALVGLTYGSPGSPLHASVQSWSAGTYSGGSSTSYDTNNSASNDTFRIDGGALQTFDVLVVYFATVTYEDGTTGSISANIVQDTDGRLYLVPEASYNADAAVLEAKPVQSLTLDSFSHSAAGLTADRYAPDYMPVVDGTSGADSMGLGDTDADGDPITAGADWIEAGDGDDTIAGGGGDDTIFGGGGDDYLTAGDGNDRLRGEAGNDTLIGGDGSDTLVGGDGDDSLVGNSSDSVTFLESGAGADTLDGSAGAYDVAQYFSSVDGVNIDLSDASVESGGDAAGDTLIGIEQIDGSDTGNDTIVADDSGMEIKGWGGDDRLTGGSADDRLEGGAGADTLSGGGGADRLRGGDGNDSLGNAVGGDTLYGEAGNDSLYGGFTPGVDDAVLDGGDGNDYFVTYGANDSVYGGAGDDVVSGDSGNEFIDGGGDDDYLWIATGSDTVYGGAGNDTIQEGGGGDDTIYGGTGADSITSGDDIQTFVVEDAFGNDTIADAGGGVDNDLIDASAVTSGITVTYSGAKAGTLTDGTDTIGFSGIERLTATAQADSIDGRTDGAGLDIDAGAGADTIWLGAGADSLDAGDGNDSIDIDGDSVGPSRGDDTILGGDGSDTLDLGDYNYTWATDAGLTGTITDAGFSITNGTDTFTGAGIEVFQFSYGGDTIDASATTTGVSLFGRDGSYNGVNDDMLIGGSGNDTISSADGHAVITGGAGDDRFFGINGSKTYLFEDGFGNDTLDGSTGLDHLNFSGLSTQNVSVLMMSFGSGAITSATDNVSFSTSALVEWFTLSSNADSFDASSSTDRFKVDGGAGDDTIVGSLAGDLLEGGAGADAIDGAAGANVVRGGAGDDTISVTGGNSSVAFTVVGDGDTVTGSTGGEVFVWTAAAGASAQITLDDGAGTPNDGDGAADIVQVMGDGASGTLVIHGFDYGTDVIYLGGEFDRFHDESLTVVSNVGGVATVIATYPNGNTQTFEIHHNNGATFNYGAAFEAGIAPGLDFDILDGGDDADTFQVADGFAGDTVTGGEGGTDFDVLDLSAVTSGVTVDWTAAEAGTVVSGADTLTFAEIERVILTGNADSLDARAETVGINIDGASGSDVLRGGSGNDTIAGGSGGDDIVGGGGDDLLQGGSGYDEYFFAGGWGTDTISDTGSGSELDFTAVTADLTITFAGATGFSASDGINAITGDLGTFSWLSLGDGDDLVDLSGQTTNIVAWIAVQGAVRADGNDTIIGSDFDDGLYMFGGTDGDSIRLGDGADYIEASSGDDTIYGEAGNDDLRGYGGNDYIDGGDGDDRFYDSEGQDTLIGGAGNDWFFADDGSNAIYGGTGNDTVEAGDGDDTIFIEDGFGTDSIEGGETVESRGDRLNFSAMTVGISIAYSGEEAGSATDGTDTLSFAEIEELVLTAQGDSVDATTTTAGRDLDMGAGDDSFVGGTGGDTISGGAGNDSIAGGAGNDLLKTGQGQDTLDGGDGDDTLMNSAGDDSLVGGDGNDLLVATQGNDTLEGGAGSDTLMGGTGGDSLDGGAGDDLLLADLAGVAFNATGTDGVGIAANITDFPTNAVTYEITLASTDTVGDTSLGSYAVPGQDNEFSLQLQAGSLAIYVGGSFTNTGIPEATFLDGNVNTLAVTWQSSGGALKVYLNGANIYSGTTANGTTLDTGGTFTLGQDQDFVGGGFDQPQAFEGTIYGVRLYDDVRTPAEILDSVQGPIADTTDPNLVANWVADPDAASFTDLTGSHAMTMSGDVAATWSEGNDTLIGGTGADTIFGGGGNDSIEGGGGFDSLDGGDGNDVILGGYGTDTMDGGSGTDTVSYADAFGTTSEYVVLDLAAGTGELRKADGSLTDTETVTNFEAAIGSSGDDIIAGTAGDNTLLGMDGADTIYGGAGADRIEGGSNSDTIYGGAGDDTLLGQNENDTFIIEDGFGNDSIVGGETNSWLDTVDLSAVTSGVTASYSGDEAGTITDGADTITFAEIERFVLTDRADSVQGSSDSAGMTLSGLGGNDTLRGGTGDDSIDGGADDDDLRGGSAEDSLIGGAGNDTLWGQDGNDSMVGDDGADHFIGGSGNDTGIGGSGADILHADSGDDSLAGGDDADTFRIYDAFGADTIDGGEGGTDSDALDFNTYMTATGIDVAFSGNEAGTATNGTDTLNFTGIEGAALTNQNDTLDASLTTTGVDIEGWGGDDSLTGGSGADTLAGGVGADTFLGGAGDDRVSGWDGADRISGGTGADSLAGGDDADTFVVEDGFGADTVQGGGGGTDSDRLDFSAMSVGIAVAYGANEAGSATDGTDTLSFAEIEALTLTAQGDSIDASATTVGTDIDGGDGADTLTGGSGDDTLAGGDGDDLIDGGAGDDLLTTGLGQDTLLGGDGNDTLMNAAGDDCLVGGAGNDSLVATDGNDTLVGGTGDDTMEGGADADTFVIEDGFGNDVVTGGEGTTAGTDSDTIDGSALTGAVTATFSGDEAGTVTDGTDTITFTEVENVFTGQGDDVLDASLDSIGVGLFGNEGSDTITGGTGDDYIHGGDDADSIRLNAGFGNDTVFGGEGGTDDDTIDLSAITTGVTVTYTGAEAGTITDGTDTITFSEIEELVLTGGNDSVDGGADSLGLDIDAGGGDDIVQGGAGNDSLAGDSQLLRDGEIEDPSVAPGQGTSSGNLGAWQTDTGFEVRGSGSGGVTTDDGGDFLELDRFGSTDNIYQDVQTAAGQTYLFSLDARQRTGAEGQSFEIYWNGMLVDTVTPDSTTEWTNYSVEVTGTGGLDRLEIRELAAESDGLGNFLDNLSLVTVSDDTLAGGDGDDTIGGGAGDDSLSGDAGNDIVAGGAGNDTLSGGTGDDALSGGDDADTFVVTDGFGNDTITGGEGGTDADVLDLSGHSGPVTVSYTGDEAGTITDGTDTITFSEIEYLIATDQADVVDASGQAGSVGIDVDTRDGDDTITGGDNADTIQAGAGLDVVDGGSGDDSIDAGDGDDSVLGNGGNDTIQGGTGNDSIDGGGSADSIEGGLGDDSLIGGGGNDTVRGGAGDDTIIGRTGSDRLFGDDDDDTFSFTGTFSNDTVFGGEGGTDDDLIDLSGLGTGIAATYSGIEAGTVTAGTNTIAFSEIERLTLTEQADDVNAAATSAGLDIDARGGNDTVLGGSGDDTVQGGSGSDTLVGGGGADSLLGGDGGDLLVGGNQGNSFATDGDAAATGADTLDGGAGADTIFGNTGDDSLIGGTGDDSLLGEWGDDTFAYAPGDGADTIADFNKGNSGALNDGDTTNNDFIDLGGFYDSMSELRADFDDDGVLNQSNTTDAQGNALDYSDNLQFGGGDSLTFQGITRFDLTPDNTGVICFAKGTLIATPTGEVPIESLVPGDLVLTRDNGPQPLVWTGRRHLGRQKLAATPRLRPILLKPELTGAHSPLIVSPQHGILLRSDGEERLIRAVHLARMEGGAARSIHDSRGVTYLHVMFETHQIVFANGAPSESFYPGPQAVNALNRPARHELLTVFPSLATLSAPAAFGPTARPFSRGRELPDHARALVRA